MTTKTKVEVTPTAANVLAVWERATAEQVSEGMEWYGMAHTLALELSPDDVRKGAGVLAALSPNESWERNMFLARQTFAEGRLTGGTLGNSVAKANAILGAAPYRADIDPLEVMGKGLKTRSFYGNIADPLDDSIVTIDRHAYDVALDLKNAENVRLGLTAKRYEAFSAAYRGAARSLGILPSQVQAVTWVAWRSRWAWRTA